RSARRLGIRQGNGWTVGRSVAAETLRVPAYRFYLRKPHRDPPRAKAGCGVGKLRGAIPLRIAARVTAKVRLTLAKTERAIVVSVIAVRKTRGRRNGGCSEAKESQSQESDCEIIGHVAHRMHDEHSTRRPPGG